MNKINKLNKMSECMNYFIDKEKGEDALTISIELYGEIKDFKKYEKELKRQLESIIEGLQGKVK